MKFLGRNKKSLLSSSVRLPSLPLPRTRWRPQQGPVRFKIIAFPDLTLLHYDAEASAALTDTLVIPLIQQCMRSSYDSGAQVSLVA